MIVSLHWAAGAIILALIAMGWAMIHGGLDSAWTFDIYQWHKSWGFVALVADSRPARGAPRQRFPAGARFPRWERRLAAATQASLYILTICAILSGWLVVSASPLPVPTRFFDLFVVPNIAPADPSLFAGAVLAHKIAAWTIAALVALHVIGALKHHFADGDDVLQRMAPRWRRLSPPRG